MTTHGARLTRPSPDAYRAPRSLRRLGLAVLSSVACHWALLTLLPKHQGRLPRLPEPQTWVELTAPVPEPERVKPEPLEPPPAAPSEPVQAALPRALRPANQPVTPARAQPTEKAPLRLLGLSLSNAGFAMPSGTGGRATVSAGPPSAGLASGSGSVRARPREDRQTSHAQEVIALADLSSKPVAPSLDGELSRNYPTALRSRGVEGDAMVRLLLSREGRVVRADIVHESAAGFGSACQRTVLDSRWSTPLDRSGKPVRTRLSYRCRFAIRM